METKIQLTHPAGKKAVRIAESKYEILKKAILNCLRLNGELTHTEILQAITKEFIKRKIKFEGSVEWYMESVKLDLEAKKEIKRITGSPVVKYATG
jgi:hypothetical protein